MSKDMQITFVSKDNSHSPYERITYVGGALGGGWKLTPQEAITQVERGKWYFYVSIEGKSVWGDVDLGPHGRMYLKSRLDGEEPKNLLSLPKCP